MINDPIVEKVRQVREAHAARFNNDLDAIYRDLKGREKASGRKYVTYPARRPHAAHAAGVPQEDQLDTDHPR